jgi:hypothetical protein
MKKKFPQIPEKPQHHKQPAYKWVALGVAVGGLVAFGYWGWKKLHKSQIKPPSKTQPDNEVNSFLYQENHPSSTPATIADSIPHKLHRLVSHATSENNINTSDQSSADSLKTSSDFPLKKGSRGPKVRQLQLALITKYGKSILPKYGADGSFGNETMAALNKLKDQGILASAMIDENMFNILTADAGNNMRQTGSDLYDAAQANDYHKAIPLLQNLKNTDDYKAANTAFKSRSFSGRISLLSGMFNAFKEKSQRDNLRILFGGMGLHYDKKNGEWSLPSLSGYGGPGIITIEPTIVWINTHHKINVPARMVLGNEVCRHLNYCLFENAGDYFMVPEKSIRCI